MMSSYAIQTADDPRIRAWFVKVDKRLRDGSSVFLSGAARPLGRGLYAVSIKTTVDSFAFTTWPLMFIVAGVASWFVWHNAVASNWLVGGGLVAIGIVYGIMAPGVHRLLIRITLWRLTGRWVRVKPASQEALRRLAHGLS